MRPSLFESRAPQGDGQQRAFSRCTCIRALLTTTTLILCSLRMIPEKWRPVFGPGSCAIKKGKRSAERRIVEPMSAHRRQVYAVCANRLGAARVSHGGRNAAFRRSRLRHSPPALTPMAQLQNRVSRRLGWQVFCLLRSDDAAVKHAPCGPVLVPVDRGPESRPSADWQFRPRGPHLAVVLRHAVRKAPLNTARRRGA
jgi:hypothetical protein